MKVGKVGAIPRNWAPTYWRTRDVLYLRKLAQFTPHEEAIIAHESQDAKLPTPTRCRFSFVQAMPCVGAWLCGKIHIRGLSYEHPEADIRQVAWSPLRSFAIEPDLLLC